MEFKFKFKDSGLLLSSSRRVSACDPVLTARAIQVLPIPRLANPV
jgi:hypothetical protein